MTAAGLDRLTKTFRGTVSVSSQVSSLQRLEQRHRVNGTRPSFDPSPANGSVQSTPRFRPTAAGGSSWAGLPRTPRRHCASTLRVPVGVPLGEYPLRRTPNTATMPPIGALETPVRRRSGVSASSWRWLLIERQALDLDIRRWHQMNPKGFRSSFTTWVEIIVCGRPHKMIYTHVINRGALGVKSPADRL